MSWISEVGLPFNTANINTGNIYATGNITADGSITANNSFYVSGNGADRYYLSNSGTNDDAIYSYPVGGGYFYSLIDTHNNLQLRAVDTNGNAQVPFVINNNLLTGANVGGTITFDCIGSNAGVPTNVRPSVSNYNIMTNAVPSQNELITYYDYQNIQTTKNIGSVVQMQNLINNAEIYSTTNTILGTITLSSGVWSINMLFDFYYTPIAVGNSVNSFEIYWDNLPQAYINPAIIYYNTSGTLFQKSNTSPIYPSSVWAQSFTQIVYLTGNTTLTLRCLAQYDGVGSSLIFNNSPGANKSAYINATKIG